MKRLLTIFLTLILLLSFAPAVIAAEEDYFEPKLVTDMEEHPILAEYPPGWEQTSFSVMSTGTKSYPRVLITTIGDANGVTGSYLNTQTVTFTGNYYLYIGGVAKYKIISGTTYKIVKSGTGLQLRNSSETTVLASGTSFEFRSHQSTVRNQFTAYNANYKATYNYPGDLFAYNTTFSHLDTKSYNAVYLVNKVYMQDYIKGIIGYEIGWSTHIEAQKSQAILARTYCLARISSANTYFDIYDNGAKAQVYKGIPKENSTQADRAVDETDGKILVQNGKTVPIITAYSATNGGVVNTSKIRWGTTLAYEAVKGDVYDEEYVLAHSGGNYIERWYIPKNPTNGTTGNTALTTLINNALIPALKKAGHSSAAGADVILTNIHMEQDYHFPDITYDGVRKASMLDNLFVTFAGTLRGVAFENIKATIKRTDLYVAANPTYGYFSKPAITEYWLHDYEDQYLIRHGRWGHAVGMSQVSAMRQASNHGRTAEQITTFFYSGVSVIKSPDIGDRIPLTKAPDQTGNGAYLMRDTSVYKTNNLGSDIIANLSAGQQIVVAPAGMDFYSVSTGGFIPADVMDAPDSAGSYTVSVTLPVKYQGKNGSTELYINGQKVTSVYNDETKTLTAALYSGIGQVATIYTYTPHPTDNMLPDIPNGMCVWQLSFQGDGYSSAYLSDYDDGLGYGGFSIRLSTPAGIRTINAISTALRTKLLSTAGVGGYKLTEYGALAMVNAYTATEPFIIGGANTMPKSAAYYKSGNTTYDIKYDTTSTLTRFAAVVTGIPNTNYITDIAFRPYLIVTAAGSSFTIYGAPVARSIYTTAKQVEASYPTGFIRDIINYVEGN